MNEQNCSSCGQPWENATFLSETFNYGGGSMVFQCQCGNEKSRNFLPTDVMPIEEAMKYIMIQEGMDKDVIESSVNHYKAIQLTKKIRDHKL